jgi:diaminopimelate epimerase
MSSIILDQRGKNMKFTKMQGLGNDYIYVDCFFENIDNPSFVAKHISDRHFGVGSDGLVLILPSLVADFKMRMFNSDGSESEMCGNAIRCVGKYVYDNRLTDKTFINIETLAGIKGLDIILENNKSDSASRVALVKVDMGEPILIPRDIPVDIYKSIFLSEPLKIDHVFYSTTCVSMGNPHAVIYVDDVSTFPLEDIGRKVENHSLFPRKINAEFVQIIDRQTLKMRVWERGAGETLACGTGACAVLVASVLNNVSERKAMIKLLGGDLLIEWQKENNHVYMTGPAVTVFDGEINL